MSPAGLVVNYNFREADAHLNFSPLVSKAEPLGLPHTRGQRYKGTETEVMEVVAHPALGIAIARARGPIGFPRGTPRNASPIGLRRQLLPALHLLYRCNLKHFGNCRS